MHNLLPLYYFFFFTMKNSYLIVNLCVEFWAEAANPIILETQIFFSLLSNLDMAERAVKVMRASVCLRALHGAHTLVSVGRWCLDPSAPGPWKALEDCQVQQLYFAGGSGAQRRKVMCHHRSMGLNHFSLFFYGSEQRNFIWLNCFLQIVLQLNMIASQTICYFYLFC